jgi:hypothetical protein
MVSNRLIVGVSGSLRSDPVRMFEILSSVGEIQQVDFSKLQVDSTVSVTYFDVRVARKATIDLVGDFRSVEPDNSYNPLANRSVRLGRSPGVSLDDTISALSKFGEIERISFAGLEELVVEFFDSRSPVAVMAALSNSSSCPVGGEARKANYCDPPPSVPGGREDSDFDVDIERIESGDDTRTTLMIRNIPNKYTQKNLIKLIDLIFKDKYDFFYLPIDFKNKCNVGYAFINFRNYLEIVNFFKLFNLKKWEKFNSEKISKISFARLQGQKALIDHFKSSSVMQQNKSLRPFFIKPDGQPSYLTTADESGSVASDSSHGGTGSGSSILTVIAGAGQGTIEGIIFKQISKNS